jgi:hypothetical protein
LRAGVALVVLFRIAAFGRVLNWTERRLPSGSDGTILQTDEGLPNEGPVNPQKTRQ